MSATATATMDTMARTLPANAITWFELPTLDLERATQFYEAVLDAKLIRGFYGEPMSVFPVQSGGFSGALVCRADHRPGTRGPRLYLDCNGILEEATERVVAAGGLVLTPVTVIEGGFGRFSTIRDTEGNQIHLHSR